MFWIRELDYEEWEEIEPNLEEIKITENIFEYMLKRLMGTKHVERP